MMSGTVLHHPRDSSSLMSFGWRCCDPVGRPRSSGPGPPRLSIFLYRLLRLPPRARLQLDPRGLVWGLRGRGAADLYRKTTRKRRGEEEGKVISLRIHVMGTIHAGKRRRPFFFIFGAPPDYQQHRVLFDEQSLAVADLMNKSKRGVCSASRRFFGCLENQKAPPRRLFLFSSIKALRNPPLPPQRGGSVPLNSKK